MSLKIIDILKIINDHFDEAIAEDWDNTGLVCGDPRTAVSKIITCVDITEDVLAKALAEGANLIIAHHPLAMKPFFPITPQTAKGRMIYQAIRHEVALYCAHTNVDVAPNGLCYHGAKALGLENIVSAGVFDRKNKKIIVTCTPAQEAEACAILASFDIAPRTVASPSDNEVRIEATVPQERCKGLTAKLYALDAEMNIDILTLDNLREDLYSFALGDIATCDTEAFVHRVKNAFDLPCVRIGGRMDKKIKRVAFCGGAGKSFLPAVIRSGADAYVTGDVGHHDFQSAYEAGILLIDATHYGTEKIFSTMIRQVLLDAAPELADRVLPLAQDDYFSTLK